MPCDFFFKDFSFDGAGDEIREANEKEEGLQAIQATRIEEGKLQPIKQSSCMSIVEQHFFTVETVRGFDEVARFQGNPKGLHVLVYRFESPHISYCH